MSINLTFHILCSPVEYQLPFADAEKKYKLKIITAHSFAHIISQCLERVKNIRVVPANKKHTGRPITIDFCLANNF